MSEDRNDPRWQQVRIVRRIQEAIDATDNGHNAEAIGALRALIADLQLGRFRADERWDRCKETIEWLDGSAYEEEGKVSREQYRRVLSGVGSMMLVFPESLRAIRREDLPGELAEGVADDARLYMDAKGHIHARISGTRRQIGSLGEERAWKLLTALFEVSESCSCGGTRHQDTPRYKPGTYEATRKPRVDLAALRVALGSTDQATSEAMERKGSGTLGVDSSAMWAHFTTVTYSSGDLPSVATREALQNARDALREAQEKGLVRAKKRDAARPAPTFRVVWDETARSLTWEDNGVGMDESTLLNKFLVLGGTGKASAGDSAGRAGGFGVAKAVILGVSESFKWELHTRNTLAKCEGRGQAIDLYEAETRQGTRLTVYDIPASFLYFNDRVLGKLHILERLAHMLGSCDIIEMMRAADQEPSDVAPLVLVLEHVLASGERRAVNIEPLFSRRAGSVLVDNERWASGVQATVKAYRRPPGDRGGGYYVRLGGLIQHRRAASSGRLKTDIVVDLFTSIRPGQTGYPLTASRDSLNWPTVRAFDDLVEIVERENESTSSSKDDEVLDPEDWSGKGAEEISDLTHQAFQDAEFAAALKGAAGSLTDFYQERQKYRPVKPSDESSAPAISVADAKAGEAATAEGFSAVAVAAAVVGEDAKDAPGAPPAALAQQLGAVLQGASVLAPEGDKERIWNPQVQAAVAEVAAGRELSGRAAFLVNEALEGAGEVHLQGNGGGMMGVLAVSRVTTAVSVATGGLVQREANPFGKLAGLRISKKNYDAAKARKFKANYAKWIPLLVAWDGTLRLICQEARIRKTFKPGFVLDDAVLAKVSTTGKYDRGIVYIHPDMAQQIIKAHKTRPLAIASYLFNLACHELTHLDGRMGDGHGEEFVSAREDLAAGTGHLLPAIAVLVVNLLSLPKTEMVDAKEMERVRKMLDAAKASRDELRKKVREFERAQPKDCPEPEQEEQDPPEVEEEREPLDLAPAESVLSRALATVEANLPSGFERSYFNGFVSRNRDSLLQIVAAALAERDES